MAELLAAARLDDTGTFVTLTPAEWRERWDDLRVRYPQDFRPRGAGEGPGTRPAAGRAAGGGAATREAGSAE